MEVLRKKALQFLEENLLLPEQFDMEKTVEAFQNEMAKGLAPGGSSLPMFPSYIEEKAGTVPHDVPVAVIDAGGTNFRTALVTFPENGDPVIEDFRSFAMPGVEKEVSAAEFFRLVADHAEPVIRRSEYLGFCFSYPMIQESAHDGVVKNWTKEVKAPEVIGLPVARGLREELKGRGVTLGENLVLLNDTVATLLAGKVARGLREETAGDYIGFIFGTGQNCAYLEQNEKITKVSGLTPGLRQVINMESANFSLAPRGPLDEAFLNSTENPSLNRFEKIASGAYLGPLTGYVLKSPAAVSIFSSPAAGALEKLPGLKTIDVDYFLRDPLDRRNRVVNPLAACLESEVDTVSAWTVVDALLERAAKAVAVNLSAVVLWGGHGEDPTRPVRLCIDGSTFYKLKGFRPRVEYYLKQYLQDRKGRYYEIVQVENAPLLGAAVAGLTG